MSSPAKRYTMRFTAGPEDIDMMGHVNNAVWLRWVQDIATAHWEAAAPAEYQRSYLWVVTRHEIDYRGNIGEGEDVEAVSFIPDPPKGARFDRLVEFRDGSGRRIVAARSIWAMIDRETGRLTRVPPELASCFLGR